MEIASALRCEAQEAPGYTRCADDGKPARLTGKLTCVETVLCPFHGLQMADEEGYLVEWLG